MHVGGAQRYFLSSANLRLTPHTSANVVSTLKMGDRVLFLRKESGWYEVLDPLGKVAWVFGNLVEEVQT